MGGGVCWSELYPMNYFLYRPLYKPCEWLRCPALAVNSNLNDRLLLFHRGTRLNFACFYFVNNWSTSGCGAKKTTNTKGLEYGRS